jgi:hypothetical protein
MRGWCVVLLAAAAAGGPAAAQLPSVPGTTFGSQASQPFNESVMFPNGRPSPKPAKPPAEDPPPVVIPDGSMPPPPPPRVWTGGVEFGVNGAQGNADILNVRFGAGADRKTDANLFHTDFLYTLSRQDNKTRQNQALFNARDEILFRNGPWSVFAAVQGEFDEFRDYDLRAGSYSGFGYTWCKTDDLLFRTRAGAGATYETSTRTNGPADRWVPEALLGVDLHHRFTDRQSFILNADVYPSLGRLGQYRIRARAAYEIVIDPVHCVVLRLGVQERYDSSPGTSKRNDLNYFATLLFKF